LAGETLHVFAFDSEHVAWDFLFRFDEKYLPRCNFYDRDVISRVHDLADRVREDPSRGQTDFYSLLIEAFHGELDSYYRTEITISEFQIEQVIDADGLN
jgi:hypothetical protein